MLQPFGTRVLVRRHKPKTTTDGGVVLPDSAQKPPHIGIAIAVGAGCSTVKEGDEVWFPTHAGVWVILPDAPRDEQHIILREEDLLGKTTPTTVK